MHWLVSLTPCSDSYKISLSLKFRDISLIRGWFKLFGVAFVQSWISTLSQSIMPEASCAFLVSRIVSPISGCSVLASMPPSALRLRCCLLLEKAKSFRMLSTAEAMSSHSASLPTPLMSRSFAAICGPGGCSGAGLSGAVFDQGSGARRSRPGSSCACLRVL